MKILITTICLLISNIVYSCVFFYTGDDIRIQLLNSGDWDYSEYYDFNYSYSYIYSSYTYNSIYENEISPNTDIDKYNDNLMLWAEYCESSVKIEDIYTAIYLKNIKLTKNNAFIDYLKDNKKNEALKYLIFAQKCTPYNKVNNYDSWENDDKNLDKKRSKIIKKADIQIAKTKDPEIKRRYAFLIIRLAYYNNDLGMVDKHFNKYFKDSNKDILYYWSMHYNNENTRNEYENTFNKAQIFYYAIDKRITTYYDFDKYLDKQQVLEYAENNIEKSAVEFLYAIKNPGQALEGIKEIYNLNPQAKQLDFLLIREINKIEDWILTPQYTNFNNIIYGSRDKQYDNITERIEDDKQYANLLLGYLIGIDKSKVNNPLLWETSIAYLYQIVDQPKNALAHYNIIENNFNLGTKEQDNIDQLKVLSLVGSQNNINVQITKDIAEILYKNKENYKLLFTVASEFYSKGNINDAICIFSTLGSRAYQPIELDYNMYYSYYDISNYFEFADMFATYSDMDQLINYIENTVTVSNEFNKWYKSQLTTDINKIYDLAGTKYLRADKLEQALSYYKQIDDNYWKASYAYTDYLDANPFYTNLEYSHEKTIGDTIVYNKEEVVSLLIDYLEKAADPQNPDRDLDYFTAANCYYNMTFNGNSWIMKKYYWSNAHYHNQNEGMIEAKEDKNDYFNARLAIKYYRLAEKHSKTKSFGALSYTMAGKCRKGDINAQYQYWESENNIDADDNQFFTKVMNTYPDYYVDMVGNCSFEKYYFARLSIN